MSNLTIEEIEEIDGITERIIDIFGQETDWHRQFNGDSAKLNILGRLRMRISDELRSFRTGILEDLPDCDDYEREPAFDYHDLD